MTLVDLVHKRCYNWADIGKKNDLVKVVVLVENEKAERVRQRQMQETRSSRWYD